jgi:hypothetical protein
MTRFKKVLLFIVFALAVIQFIPPAKNEMKATSGHQLQAVFPVPNTVQQILSTSCNDCHSNNTARVWYDRIQPAAWWMASHVSAGKEELNFDEFATYSLRRQFHKFEEIVEMLEEGEMPLNSYLWMHGNAKLNEDQKNTLVNWTLAMQDTMKAHFPIDSLQRRK